MTNILDVHI